MNTYFRKKALFYSAVIIFLPILFRFFELQVIDFNKYKKLAGNNSLRAIEIKAPRGIIYDRDSIPLVDNVYNYNFEIMPIDIIDKRSKEIYQKFNFALIDSIIGINKNELTKKIYSRNKIPKGMYLTIINLSELLLCNLISKSFIKSINFGLRCPSQ